MNGQVVVIIPVALIVPLMIFQSKKTSREELDSMAKCESMEDKIFQKFKTQITLEPVQVRQNAHTPHCVLSRSSFANMIPAKKLFPISCSL